MRKTTDGVSRRALGVRIKSTLLGMSPALRYSLLACFLSALVVSAIQLFLVLKPYGFVPGLVFGVVGFLAAVCVSVLVTLLFSALKKLHWMVVLVFLASMLICVTALALQLYLIPLWICGMAAVYLVAMCITGRYKSYSKPKRILRLMLTALFSIATCGLLFLILWPGPALMDADRPEKAMLALPFAEDISSTAALLRDPSAPGPCKFSTYYYATPGQKNSPYPDMECIPATSVDASQLVEGWSTIRTSLLGFTPDALPLNAQVWIPEGPGPFPLALIVHGNHESGDRSDGGYAYLGELLASRGIIAASVDENFLNSSPLYDVLFFAGLKEENNARAFVLLEHLQQWYGWNADTSSVFFGKVDFDNLALIGHSRGGEAVALAAAFSQLDHYPNNGSVTFSYPFQVKTVVAISPVHNENTMAGLELGLQNINYLVLHGEHDMDVISFMGANMYRKADVSEDGVKALVWMQYANHGQFNSAWGAGDAMGLMRLVFQEKLMMPMAEQQQAAKVFVSAFFETTLHGKTEYSSLFRDFAQGADWLPPARYITDYADSQMTILDTYDGSYDLSSSSSGMVSYTAQGFDKWTVDALPGKNGNSNRVLSLSWGAGTSTKREEALAPVFEVEFEEGVLTVGDKLFLSLCSAEGQHDETNIDFSIQFFDSEGNIAEMSINAFGGVVNPIDAPIAKPLVSSIMGSSEPVLQAVCIPTGRFEGISGEIVKMEWKMNTIETGTNGQTLYVDDLRVEKLMP